MYDDRGDVPRQLDLELLWNPLRSTQSYRSQNADRDRAKQRDGTVPGYCMYLPYMVWNIA